MKIFVAYDLSPRSDRALMRAFALAKALGAEIEVLAVVDADLPEELRTHSIEWARKALACEIDGIADAAGVKSAGKVLAGEPARDIIAEAHACKADLIVLGLHKPAGSLMRSFGETTAGRLLRASAMPVLVAKEDAARPYATVVVGVDFSVYSRAAIRQAFRIAPAARFHLVHAYHVPYKAFLHGISDDIAYEDRLRLDAFLKEEMDLAGEHARRSGIAPDAVETLLCEGAPQEVLAAETARLGADLIVIGTHGRTGISRWAMGSIAAHLLEDPPCDVLAVKPY